MIASGFLLPLKSDNLMAKYSPSSLPMPFRTLTRPNYAVLNFYLNQFIQKVTIWPFHKFTKLRLDKMRQIIIPYMCIEEYNGQCGNREYQKYNRLCVFKTKTLFFFCHPSESIRYNFSIFFVLS